MLSIHFALPQPCVLDVTHPFSENAHAHLDLHMFVCVSEHPQVFHKPTLMLCVLIQITCPELDIHGISQLHAPLLRYNLPYPICTVNQPLLKMKGHLLLWLFPILTVVFSLERPLSVWSSMAPGLSRCCWCVTLFAECAGPPAASLLFVIFGVAQECHCLHRIYISLPN